MTAQSIAYHAHGTADGGKSCCYPWLVCHDIKSAMHCALRLAPTMINHLTSNTSPLLFSPTSSLTFVPNPDSPKDQPPPSPTSSTSSPTSFHTCNTSSQHNKALSPELFSPTPTSQNKWPSPPHLPQRSPRIRRHNLRNLASLASTNRSQEKCNSVGAPPLDSLNYASLASTNRS